MTDILEKLNKILKNDYTLELRISYIENKFRAEIFSYKNLRILDSYEDINLDKAINKTLEMYNGS